MPTEIDLSSIVQMGPTKTKFLEAYRIELCSKFDWARKDKKKLEGFMSACSASINVNRNEWRGEGLAAQAAWETIGGKGKVTVAKLRSLPQ